MNLAIEETIYCSKHTRRTVKYICFDEGCIHESQCCEICVLKDHLKCSNDFLLRKENFHSKLRIEDTTVNKAYLNKRISEIFNRQTDKLITQLKGARNEKLLQFYTNLKAITGKVDILKIDKSKYNIEYDTKRRKVVLSTKGVQVEEEELEDYYTEILFNLNSKLFKELDKINLINSQSVNKSDWTTHGTFQLTFKEGKTVIKKKSTDKYPNINHIAILKVPVNKKTIKIKLFEDQSAISSVQIGFFEKTNLESFSKTHVLKTADYYFSVNKSAAKNMTTNKSGCSLLDFFTVGTDIYAKLEDKCLTVCNFQSNGEYRAENVVEGAEYYLFVSVMKFGAYCEIELTD